MGRDSIDGVRCSITLPGGKKTAPTFLRGGKKGGDVKAIQSSTKRGGKKRKIEKGHRLL